MSLFISQFTSELFFYTEKSLNKSNNIFLNYKEKTPKLKTNDIIIGEAKRRTDKKKGD